MKPLLELSARTMTLIAIMISGAGCAQTYIPRRYYGTTTYTTQPRVYTTQPITTYSTPAYYRTTTYTTPTRVYTTQPVTAYSVPTYRYQTTTYAPVVRQMSDVEKRAAEITRQVNRQAAEIEARVRRQTEEIEASVRRQTEEVERRIAQQTATARQVAQSTRRPTQTVTRVVPSQPYTQSSIHVGTGWLNKLPSGVSHYPNVKLGDGFVPHAVSSDTRALLIWPVSAWEDLGNATRNLVAVKKNLNQSEPDSAVEMVLLTANEYENDIVKERVQGIHCIEEARFPAFAERFFARCSSGTVPDVSARDDGEWGESQWNAIVSKAREWSASATNFLETAPWWVWTIGAVLVFIVVFAVCVRDANSLPFQENDDDPWVVDPSGR